MSEIDAEQVNRIYAAIAESLRDFGYRTTNADMIREVHEAMQYGAKLPHDVIGMFAKAQLDEAFGVSDEQS
jgi:hypothetical protein